MPRRLFCLLLLALLVVAPAAGDVGTQKANVDAKIGNLRDKIASARAREARLSSEIKSVTTQIRALEARVGDVSSKLAVLQDDLALHQRRLAKLNQLFRLQTKRFDFLRAEYHASLTRLDARLGPFGTGDRSSCEDRPRCRNARRGSRAVPGWPGVLQS